MKNTRIDPKKDTPIQMVIKLSENNTNTINVLMMILNDNKIDPNDKISGIRFNPLFILDSLNIYGEKIYFLYNEICGGNLAKMLAVIKAVQFQILDFNVLKEACLNEDKTTIPVDELYVKIKEMFTNFDS